MSDRYRLVRRGNRYYAADRHTCERESLHTDDRSIAKKLLAARNETARCANLNLAIGRTYLSAHDPALIGRKWRVRSWRSSARREKTTRTSAACAP